MTKAFGTWFRDYPGSDPVLLQLQVHWDAHLVNDYLPSRSFKTAKDVSTTFKRGFSDQDYIEAQIERAFAEYQRDVLF